MSSRFEGVCDRCRRWAWLRSYDGKELCDRCRKATRPPDNQLGLGLDGPQRSPHDPARSDWGGF